MSRIPLVANYIAKADTDLEAILLEASLRSVKPACSRVVLVHAPNDSAVSRERVRGAFDRVCSNDDVFIEYPGKVDSFAALRNLALDQVHIGEFFYWIDADEVAFTDNLISVLQRASSWIEQGEDIAQIRTRFVHFCVNPRWFERMEPRNTIIRKGPETKWEGSVHERVVGVLPGRILNSDYTVHHYGYCKPQEEVFKHWQHYAELEGDPNRYVNEEVDGKTVAYFRAERPSAANILDDRIKTLLPYTGKYPDLSVLKYLLEVCPHV